MSTIRIDKTENYTVIANQPLNDKRLSWAARGMLAYLLTKPNDWTVRMSDLIAQSPGSRTTVRTIFSELEEYGYVKRERVRGEKKLEWQTTVYEDPSQGTIPVDRIPVDRKPADIVSTEEVSTEEDSPTPKKRKEKSAYDLSMEALEAHFSDIRGCPPPDWGGDPKGSNKTWRTPLKLMLQKAGGDMERASRGIEEVTERMMADGLTFSAPVQIMKSFDSWLIDNPNGNAPKKTHKDGGLE